MAISEESRHHLHQRLAEVLGPEDAATLMEHLPPVGWADVATKRDLDSTETRLAAKLDTSIANVLAELHKSVRNAVIAFVLANSTLAAIATGAATAL